MRQNILLATLFLITFDQASTNNVNKGHTETKSNSLLNSNVFQDRPDIHSDYTSMLNTGMFMLLYVYVIAMFMRVQHKTISFTTNTYRKSLSDSKRQSYMKLLKIIYDGTHPFQFT